MIFRSVYVQQEAGLAALRRCMHWLTRSRSFCIPRSLARLRILDRSFLLGVFSDVHARTKCGRSSGADLHRGHVGLTLFWLNLALVAWRLYELEISFCSKACCYSFPSGATSPWPEVVSSIKFGGVQIQEFQCRLGFCVSCHFLYPMFIHGFFNECLPFFPLVKETG